MPCSLYGCAGSTDHRVSCSTSGSRFGVSPYTLFVLVKMNAASGQCRLVISSTTSVPFALTVKSVIGSFAAQSCDGWAAAWMTSAIDRPYREKI